MLLILSVVFILFGVFTLLKPKKFIEWSTSYQKGLYDFLVKHQEKLNVLARIYGLILIIVGIIFYTKS